MAVVPIYGFAGNPSLMYNSDSPVVMTTPCYAQWNYIANTTSYCDMTSGTGWAKATCNTVDLPSRNFQGSCYLRMYATQGQLTLNYTVSKSSGCTNGSAAVTTYCNGSVVTYGTQVWVNSNPSDSIAVPYYRYRIFVILVGRFDNSPYQGIIGEWVKVDFTLAT